MIRGMYARRLTLALAALAGAAVLEGLAALWALSVANDHVLRGRVASDIELAFQDLTVSKLRLRSWFTQAQLDPETPAEPARRFQEDMQRTLERLRNLSARAIALDRNEATRTEHLKRQDALAVLADSVASLQTASARVRPLAIGTDNGQAWQVAGELFDISRGRDLRRLLADSIEREAAAVARERAGADQALRWMRGLLLGTAAAIALAALLLAAGFTRALRRPLDQLNEGAQALQQGQLAHRIPQDGPDEFSAVARSMNTMAIELTEHRAREVTARQQLEALVAARTGELQSALEALQQVDARRRQLFADISHELRTPTTAILGEAEITLRGRERPVADYRDALQRIVATSRQLGSVIDDLLSMARTDIDALALNRRALDLAEPLREAVEQARALAHERGVTVQGPRIDEGALPVLADAQRLRQLLLLLLDNAVRYSHPGGVVELAVQRSPRRKDGAALCEVQVMDQGIGIAADDLPRVFERSFRSTQARQHRADGSGLGLAIGRALARAHGGDITLESQPGRGTTVRLRLPLLPGPSLEAAG
ncbi:histidine kinase,HAMP domain-containing protein,histidine kinase [Burkholderiales bacterium JOSHI_001]|nr:histidine kinase,HAMP domain-containing protein,histidine kinase [Burkholderiales bacterium JOSHI_001]